METVKQHPLAFIAGTTTLVAAVGYFYFYYYQDEHDKSSMPTIKTPFNEFIPYESSQDDKEKLARAWMEKYVRSVLLKK